MSNIPGNRTFTRVPNVAPVCPPIAKPGDLSYTGSEADALAFYIRNELNSATATLSTWQAKFQQNPMSAFKRAESAMFAAAAQHVWMELQYAAENGAKVVDLIAELDRRVFRAARHPSTSTSAASNAMAQCVTSMQAKALETLRNL